MFAELCPALTICFGLICRGIINVLVAGKLLFQRRIQIQYVLSGAKLKKACAILKEACPCLDIFSCTHSQICTIYVILLYM